MDEEFFTQTAYSFALAESLNSAYISLFSSTIKRDKSKVFALEEIPTTIALPPHQINEKQIHACRT